MHSPEDVQIFRRNMVKTIQLSTIAGIEQNEIIEKNANTFPKISFVSLTELLNVYRNKPKGLSKHCRSRSYAAECGI